MRFATQDDLIRLGMVLQSQKKTRPQVVMSTQALLSSQLVEVREEDETMEEDMSPLRHREYTQLSLPGCSTRDFSFRRQHTQDERRAMATNEADLFPERIPVVVQRCAAERSIKAVTATYMSTPRNQPLSSLEAWVRERAAVRDEVELVIPVGELRLYQIQTSLDAICQECRGEVGFLYCQYLSYQTLGRLGSSPSNAGPTQ